MRKRMLNGQASGILLIGILNFKSISRVIISFGLFYISSQGNPELYQILP
jgi:hypothetical protein